MTHAPSARTPASNPIARTTLGLIIAVVAIAATVVVQATSSPTHPVGEATASTQTRALDAADGILPDGATVFDVAYPGVGNLDPDLLHALSEAASDAARIGIVIHVNSGWRSSDYQNRLLREAVSEYGSETEAARWVATAKTSEHVTGNAVDIGSVDATTWLSDHGAAYGLCQIYRNEPWHYERRPEAVAGACPPMFADPTHDPRLQH